MPTYAVHYTYIDDADRRAALRPRHRDFIAAVPGLLAAGAYAPHEPPAGLLIFTAESAGALDRALTDDPYRTEGVVTETRILQWGPALGPVADQLQ